MKATATSVAVLTLIALALSAQAAPAGLDTSGWQRIRAQVEAESYGFAFPSEGERAITSRAHRMSAAYAEDAVQVKGEGWQLGLRLVATGRKGALELPEEAELVLLGDRLEYRRGLVTEWYQSDARGIEQGFTIEAPPFASRGPLSVEIAFEGGLVPEIELGGQGAILRDAAGQVVARYAGLKAWDATGQALPARMERSAGGVALLVDDNDAVYPVFIDPRLSAGEYKLVDADATSLDRFGFAVDASSGYVIVGAPDAGSSGQGQAFLFHRNEGGSNNWGLVKKFVAGDADASDFFGYSVSISDDGTRVVVGAPGDDEGAMPDAGAAYLFDVDEGGAGNWGQVVKLMAGDPEILEEFGHSVSISANDRVAVGSPKDDDLGSFSGSVYIFEEDEGGAGNWGQEAEIQAGDGAAGDLFGIAVDLVGGQLFVGAPGADIAANTKCYLVRAADKVAGIPVLGAAEKSVPDLLSGDAGAPVVMELVAATSNKTTVGCAFVEYWF